MAGSVSVVVGGGGYLCSAMTRLASAGSNVTVADLRPQAELVADEFSQGARTAVAVSADAKNAEDIRQVLVNSG